MSRGLRNGLVMVQSGPSFRPFTDINREIIPTLVRSHFWPLLIAHNIEECILTALMELRTCEWHELLAWTQSYQKAHGFHRTSLRLAPFQDEQHWLDVLHREVTNIFSLILFAYPFKAVTAMPWLREFEEEWPLTVAWRRLDPTYPATLIRLK
ncbi:hypothetical protein B0H11DRAFT_2234350 [Mycena galericulata]|nr:hypothetical protein B0H11DRAFT_2234350 [Mycena galericulata]